MERWEKENEVHILIGSKLLADVSIFIYGNIKTSDDRLGLSY